MIFSGTGAARRPFGLSRPWFARPALSACVLASSFFLFSCASEFFDISHPSQVTEKKVASLKKRKTSKTEVEKMFGEPFDKVIVADGERYFYKDFNLRSVFLVFDKSGVLQEVEYDK